MEETKQNMSISEEQIIIKENHDINISFGDETLAPSDSYSKSTPIKFTTRPITDKKPVERCDFSNIRTSQETFDNANDLTLEDALRIIQDIISLMQLVTQKKYYSEKNLRFRARLMAKGFMQK